MEITVLRRYTSLPSAIHMLRYRCLTLLDPASWPDRNDAHFLAAYKSRVSATSVLALCFTEAFETYHHWQVFSPGRDGVCIEFDKEKLLEEIAHDPSVIAHPVAYKKITEITGHPIASADLPFLKRVPYQDEREFRMLYTSPELHRETREIEIALDSILRITLSPWMPETLAEAVKETLKDIDGCGELKVYRSTLIENERWKNAAAIE